MSDETPVRLFISHHSSKYDIAQQVEALLSERGIRCWIAPRDVPPGAPFDTAIQTAINECAAVLLLFCANSDKSRHVKRELILGDSAGRPIIPLRLEAIDPGDLAYHLADSQWIDWIDRRETVMDRVAAQARLYAGAPAELASDVKTLGEEPLAAPPPVTERKWVIPALAAALVAALGVVAFMALKGGGDPATETETIATAGLASEEAETPTDIPVDQLPEIEPTQPPPARPDAATTFTAPTQSAPSPRPAPTQSAPTAIAAVPVQEAPLRRVVQACAGAASDTEYLICANPPLNDRAREIGGLIREIRAAYDASGESASAFNSEQRSWMNAVKADCSSIACVESRQQQRIGDLQRTLSSLGN